MENGVLWQVLEGECIGGFLVDVVVEPVAEEKVRVGAPVHDRARIRIVVGIIVAGLVDGQSLGQIPLVLQIQGI